ncbi:hypothetical protein ACFLXQ_05790 [Chloroflexota bacterium]
MRNTQRRFRLDQPATYRVEIEGKLCERCAGWFDDMDIVVRSGDDGSTITTLTGIVSDQAALHGLLGSVKDLGLLGTLAVRPAHRGSETGSLTRKFSGGKRMRYLKISVLLTVLASIMMAGCTPAATPPPPTDVPPAPTEPPVVPTEEPRAQWEVILEKRVDQPARITAFLDETFGVTGGAGGAGRAHYTTDGGQTWTMAESSGG